MSNVTISFNNRTTSPEQRQLILSEIKQKIGLKERYTVGFDAGSERAIANFSNGGNQSPEDIAAALMRIFEQAELPLVVTNKTGQTTEGVGQHVPRLVDIHPDEVHLIVH